MDELKGKNIYFRKQIEELRKRGLGIENKSLAVRLTEWMETHDGKIPLSHITKNGRDVNRKEMSEEELSEVRLRSEWDKSDLRKALMHCKGISLDELPIEYQEFREQFRILREHGLGLKEAPVFDQIIEWLATHDGNMPKGTFRINNRTLKVKEFTEEQIASAKLYKLWIKSPERKAFDACKGIDDLDQLPEEYMQYRNQIAVLRKFEELRRKKILITRMRKAVGNFVGENEETRRELQELQRLIEEAKTK